MRLLRLGLILPWLLLAQPLAAQQLTIHHIDVDQGDATLLVMPNNRTLLIDSGLDSRGDEVAAFLQGLGISQIDAFMATHYDSDHYGGIDKVLATGITVSNWYDRGEKQHLPPSKTSQPQYQQYVGVAQSPVRLMPSMRIELDPDVSIVVVASNGHVRGAAGKYPIGSLDENGYSVTLLVSYNGFNYLIGGDLTQPVEERLVLEAAVGDVDVYKVNHHGSATSSSSGFLSAIRPEVAIISNGNRRDYNHPRQSVLDALQQVTGIEIYQTNKLLNISTDADGNPLGGNVPDGFIADLETTDADGTVTVIVGANSYEVSMPAKGFAKSYTIQR